MFYCSNNARNSSLMFAFYVIYQISRIGKFSAKAIKDN